MDRPTYEAARRALSDWLSTEADWPDSRDPAFQKHLFHNKVTAQDFEKAMVCHICALEAEEEPYAVAAAIALVVMNRTPVEGSPYLSACELSEPISFGPWNADILTRLLHNVDSLFDRELYDPTNGSTSFTNIHLLDPGTVPAPARVTIGSYLFT